MAINFRFLADAVSTGLRVLGRAGKHGRTGSAVKPAKAAGKAVKPAKAVWKAAHARGHVPAGAALHAGPGTSGAPPGYPGDFQGHVAVEYSPKPDGEPDPGEVVWGWVPFEEDYSRGKDRPVLLVGRSNGYLLGLMLTSRDRVSDLDGSADCDGSADYVDVGHGSWDRQGRPSEARLDRILQLSPRSIRREGAILNRDRFEKVAEGLRRRHGWS